MSDDLPRSSLPFARNFRDLIVWQKARELQRQVFEITQRFPREEMYSLTDQMRRAARSRGAQIAEAWGKRDYERHFLSKLTDADAEQMETQHWLITAIDAGYLTRDDARPLFQSCLEIGRMLSRMKDRAADFCPKDHNSRAQEDPCDFFNNLNCSTEH